MMRLNSSKLQLVLLLTAMVLAAASAVVTAQSFSQILSFQGRLANPDTGKPLPDAQYDVRFTIYDAETGGINLWQETQTVDQIGGVFSVYLGSVNPFPSDLFTGGDRWLGIKVGQDAEMPDRFRFTPTPWAISAGGISLPYSGSVSSVSPAFSISNNGTGKGLYGWSSSDSGVYGQSASGIGTSGYSNNAIGVEGINGSYGNFGRLGTSSCGVYGKHAGSGNYGSLGSSSYGVHSEHGASGNTGWLASSSQGAAGWHTASGNMGYLGTADYGAVGKHGGGNEGYLASDLYGVEGYGETAGGYFKDRDGSGYAYVGESDSGIWAGGNSSGGYFRDLDGSGYAFVGYGNRGIEAKGSELGGAFLDSDGSGWAKVASGDRGIEAQGSEAGGYFRDSAASGEAYVGYGDYGISASGNTAGGFFDGVGSVASVGAAYVGVSAGGQGWGGYFEDSDQSGFAYVGFYDTGIYALGNEMGGSFEDTDSSGVAYLAYGNRGVYALGSVAGGYFEDSDGSGAAYVGFGDRGIEGYGFSAGGYFEDTTSNNYAYVGYSSYKISGTGTVSFVQNHPEERDKVIVYAAAEGDEVATYTRGTARLVDGKAIVPLAETFKWVTNPDIGLTAHLTPRGKCEGLYVESLTTAQLAVGELHDGTSDVAFDYIIYGLRIGFEEVSIVQEKEQEAYIPSMADHRALYERSPELRDFNALERFKSMRAAAGETADVDLTASQELRDAIVEFDPALHAVDIPVE